MKDQPTQTNRKTEEAAARKERLGQALRDNLAKRKGQTRQRGLGKQADTAEKK